MDVVVKCAGWGIIEALDSEGVGLVCVCPREEKIDEGGKEGRVEDDLQIGID